MSRSLVRAARQLVSRATIDDAPSAPITTPAVASNPVAPDTLTLRPEGSARINRSRLHRALQEVGVAYASRLTSRPLPTEMTDGADVAHAPWLTGTDRVDVEILETRRAVFPLHGLDPHDPRD